MSNYDTCPVCGRVTVGWSAAMDHRIAEIAADPQRFSAAKLARAKESRRTR